MKKWHRIKDWALLGAIVLSTGIAQIARAVPIKKEKEPHATTIKLSTHASDRITFDIADLFGPGVTTSAETRQGAVDVSEDKLVDYHHLKEPPQKKNPKGGKNTDPSTVGVPDGGSASMMLGCTLGTMAFLKRKLLARVA